jgi:hypothetical protein
MSLLADRVKQGVKFSHFRDDALWYSTFDSWLFRVPLDDTANGQGSSATFLRDDKGIYFMRWIRKQMEHEKESAESTEADQSDSV